MFTTSGLIISGIIAAVAAVASAGIAAYSNKKTADANNQSAENINKEQLQVANEQFQEEKTIATNNLALQREQFDYQKELNRLQMEREDNAMQRRVADLQKAGLSPLMATDGAQAGQLISAAAPQLDMSSAFANRKASYQDIFQRKMIANQFKSQMAMQNAQLMSNMVSQLIDNRAKISQISSVDKTSAWNEKYGYRNQNLSGAIINAIEKLIEKRGTKLNLSAVGDNFANYRDTSIAKINSLQSTLESDVKNIFNQDKPSKLFDLDQPYNSASNPKVTRMQYRSDSKKLDNQFDMDYEKLLKNLSKDPYDTESATKIWRLNGSLQKKYSLKEFLDKVKDDSFFNSLWFPKNYPTRAHGGSTYW